MKKYGLELEFFVQKRDGEFIPAYLETNSIDGDPVIGDLRTGVFDTIAEAVFDLKRLIYLERLTLEAKGFDLVITPEIKVSNNFIRNLRQDRKYRNLKHNIYVNKLSVYGLLKENVLPINKYKASLQVNISNTRYMYIEDETYQVDKLFNYVDIIKGLDNTFKEDIKTTKRINGVYTIKPGNIGNRIEYRSLPNNVNLNILIEQLNTNKL